MLWKILLQLLYIYFIPFHTVLVVGVARRGGGVGCGMELEWSVCGEMTTSSSSPLNNIRHATAMYHNQLDSIQLSPTPTIPNSSLVYQPRRRQRQRAMSSAISQKVFLLCRHNDTTTDTTTDDIDDNNTDDDTDDDN